MSNLPVPYYYSQYTAKERSYVDYMGEINKSICSEIENSTNKQIAANAIFSGEIKSTLINNQNATEKALYNQTQQIDNTLKAGFSSVSNQLQSGFSEVSREIGVMNASMNMAFASLNSAVQESAQTICDRLDKMNDILNNPSLTKSRELFRRAIVSYNKGFYEEARDDLIEAINANRTDYISWFLLGKTYLFGTSEFSTVIDLDASIEAIKNALKYIKPDAKTYEGARGMAAEICFYLGLAQQTKAMDLLHVKNITECQKYLVQAEDSYSQSWDYSHEMLEARYNSARCKVLLDNVQDALVDLVTVAQKDTSYRTKIELESDFDNVREVINYKFQTVFDFLIYCEVHNGVMVKYSGPGGNIVIPDVITAIGESVFVKYESIIGITIPSSVTNIGNEAFRWCRNLKNVIIPSSVISIGDYAFDGCLNLISVKLSRRSILGKNVFPSDLNITYID